MMLRYGANLKAIRYESTSLNRIVADKSHRVIVASLELGPYFTIYNINYQLNSSIYVAIVGHCYATLIKIQIHLIAFDRLVYREVEYLIALTLMASSKTPAPELRMIPRDFY